MAHTDIDDAADLVAAAAEEALAEEDQQQDEAEPEEEAEEPQEDGTAAALAGLSAEDIYRLRPDLKPADKPADRPAEKPAENPAEAPEDRYAAEYEAIAYEGDLVKAERMRMQLSQRIAEDRQLEEHRRMVESSRARYEEEILTQAAGDDEYVRGKAREILGAMDAATVAYVRHDPAQQKLMGLIAKGLKAERAESEEPPATAPGARPSGTVAGRTPAKANADVETMADYLVDTFGMDRKQALEDARKA